MTRIGLYINTAIHLKASQVFYRCMRRLGRPISLRHGYKPEVSEFKAHMVTPIRLLDYDPAFLSRFDVEEICADKITLLHVSRISDWNTIWHDREMADLWRYNLHYFEYLLPLSKAYEDTGETRYLDKAKEIIAAWIKYNPQSGGGDGWSSYTIALRLTNWLEWMSLMGFELEQDSSFYDVFRESILEQYRYLATHLEKDLLANHYLEDLKTLVIVSLVLGDNRTYELAIAKLDNQVEEQILPDGMHFELSPMYHKIVFEDLLRVVSSLRNYGKTDNTIVRALERMNDFLYSFEKNVNVTPLFNDSGDNVSKSRKSLLDAAHELLDVSPRYRESFPDAGYYLLERDINGHLVKVIFDAGGPGPNYAAGHVHNDMLSYECYVDGRPLIVNSGTYEYAGGVNRSYFRSTAAHNTVKCGGHEQNQCWAQFRCARMGKVVSIGQDSSGITAVCKNWHNERFKRHITLDSNGVLSVEDCGLDGKSMVGYIHCASDEVAPVVIRGTVSAEQFDYSPEYGVMEERSCYRLDAIDNKISYEINCVANING